MINQGIVRVPARLQKIARSVDNPHRSMDGCLYNILIESLGGPQFKPSKTYPTAHDLVVGVLNGAQKAAVQDFQDFQDHAAKERGNRATILDFES